MKTVRRFGLSLTALLWCLPAGVAAQALSPGGIWLPQGPGPTDEGQVEGIEDGEVVGAIHTVVAHPQAAGTLYVGAVNGGVWRTHNATSRNPKWTRLTDGQASNSIGALDLDPADPSRRTLVAGIGRFSSFAGIGGGLTGLLRTTDGGETWTAIDGGGVLRDKNISGVAARGDVLVASVNSSSLLAPFFAGIWRSTDGGATFQQVSSGDGSETGLPGGSSNDLAGDPVRPGRLFTSVLLTDFGGGRNGLFRSDDSGATWTRVSDPAMDALLVSTVTNNVEIAVGRHNNVYVAIVQFGALRALFRSGDGGSTWTAMDLPVTPEPTPVGIHPGRQGAIHLSVVADPTDPNLIYVGGDRQPIYNEPVGGPFSFPNSLGAQDYTGRIFRGDASKPSGSQWAHLTHSSALGAAGGGTASHSAPHADSREMAFDARGDLIETDDGGIYRRTSPRSNTGDWFSLNGDLQTTEIHSVAYDGSSNVVFAGAQDTGVPVQNVSDQVVWSSLLTADGGDAAVDDVSVPGQSTRYTSNQSLFTFNRSYWDAANNFLGYDLPALLVVSGEPLRPQFVTPVVVNAVDPDRIAIGSNRGVYESFDRGDTIAQVLPAFVVGGTGQDPLAYGAADNPDVLYAGSGNRVYVRTAPPPAPLVLAAGYPSRGLVSDIVIDPDDGETAFVASFTGLHRTTDGGATWTDISASLLALDPSGVRSLAYAETLAGDALIAGTVAGIYFSTQVSGFTHWQRLGNALPTVPVLDLDYDAADDLLVAGTTGRGAWKLPAVASAVLAGGL